MKRMRWINAADRQINAVRQCSSVTSGIDLRKLWWHDEQRLISAVTDMAVCAAILMESWQQFS